MGDVDQIQINLDSGTLDLLNFCLAFLTFGVALDIRWTDFKQLYEQPKKVFVGLFSQWIVLPVFTLILIMIADPPPSIALGLVLVAACPGGNVSNYATNLANGNTALSVTLTSIVTLFSIVVTPLSFWICAQMVPDTADILKKINLDPASVMMTIVQLIVIPLAIGLLLGHRFPKLVSYVRKPVKVFSMVIFLAIIAGAVLSNRENIVKYIDLVFLLVLVHNGIAYVLGYQVARLGRLTRAHARAISIETGIQNSGLGLILIFNFFPGIGGMTLVAAWWGVWDLISAFALALFWKNRK